ncbi:MAG: EthD family reductase [Anaerolineales bacterium]|nr:EthD family reductase [Anaerolineales bacterium]MCB8951226.1 EthD family reductase [Ardenticatenales bacterium]
MYKLVTMYRRVDDEEALEAFFVQQHLPLAEQLPGLLRSEVCRIDGKPGGESRFHLTYALYFPSQEKLLMALASPAGISLLQALYPWLEARVISWYYGSAWGDDHIQPYEAAA